MSATVVVAPAHGGFAHWDAALAVDRCQMLAGRFGEVSWSVLIAELNELVAKLPPSLSRSELVMVTGVLGHMLARLARETSIDNHGDVTSGFLNLAYTGPHLDAWHDQWFHVTACCATLLQSDVDTHLYEIVDTRVTRMLRVIHTRYVDPRLTMQIVAQIINLCPSYAARKLRAQTGFGFLAHLHRRRIAVARRLLVETSLSIKEIAATVGYAHQSDLSKHFKLSGGDSPVAFRAMSIKPPPLRVVHFPD